MPGFNGTGPQGEGPFTGRGRGYCAQGGDGTAVGMGRGRGCRGGQGMGRGMGRGMGVGQAAANAAVPAVRAAAESLTPREYLEWLESEVQSTREKIGREG